MSNHLPQERQPNVGIEKPLQYEDFVGKSPFLRPWIPRSCYLRDLIIGSAGLLIGWAVTRSLMKYGGNIGVFLGFCTLGLTLFFFTGEIRGRYATAGVKFRMAKKETCSERARSNNSQSISALGGLAIVTDEMICVRRNDFSVLTLR